MLLLEVADVFANSFGKVSLRLARLHVRAVQPLHVLLIEDGRHRLDGLQEIGDGLDVLRVENPRHPARLVRIVRNGIPRSKDEIAEIR